MSLASDARPGARGAWARAGPCEMGDEPNRVATGPGRESGQEVQK